MSVSFLREVNSAPKKKGNLIVANAIKEARYIFADIDVNHNKYWHIKMYDDHSVITEWGRIGDAGQSKTFPHYSSYEAEKFYDKKCREKENKGYRAQKTLNGTDGTKVVTATSDLGRIAKEQIQTNSPETIKLVEMLIKENVHNILSATTLTYNDTTGLFATPLGIVTAEAISEARNLLNKLSPYVVRSNFEDSVVKRVANDYLNIIPQIIDRRQPSVEGIFPDSNAIMKQQQILDSLEASLQVALTGSGTNDASTTIKEKVFDCKLFLVDDGRVYDRINAYYKKGLKSMHTCSHLKIEKIYTVEIASMTAAYNAVKDKIGNVMELFHGTKTGNLLSIMKKGFIVPPNYTNGWSFGAGVYHSDSSTKALGYSYGYWDGTRNPHCFMFLNDVAMGKTYYPSDNTGTKKYPVDGYDSTYAKEGVSYGYSRLKNSEMIVYKTCQVLPKYLLECKA